jgi:hypothetical protein
LFRKRHNTSFRVIKWGWTSIQIYKGEVYVEKFSWKQIFKKRYKKVEFLANYGIYSIPNYILSQVIAKGCLKTINSQWIASSYCFGLLEKSEKI